MGIDLLKTHPGLQQSVPAMQGWLMAKYMGASRRYVSVSARQHILAILAQSDEQPKPPYVAKNIPQYQVMNAEYDRMNKYQVFVVPTDEIWTYRAMDSDSLTDVIPDWLVEQDITKGWTWQHEYVDELRGWRLVFRFEHEDSAFRFKMRWG